MTGVAFVYRNIDADSWADQSRLLENLLWICFIKISKTAWQVVLLPFLS